MEDERLTHAEAQICFFFISFFNLLPSWPSCVFTASVVNHLSMMSKSKTIWAICIWTICLISQCKLVYVLSWQIHSNFWCALKCCQSMWTVRRHNKAILQLLSTGSWWKCSLSVREFAFMQVWIFQRKQISLLGDTPISCLLILSKHTGIILHICLHWLSLSARVLFNVNTTVDSWSLNTA